MSAASPAGLQHPRSISLLASGAFALLANVPGAAAHPFGLNTNTPCLPQHKYVKVGPPIRFLPDGAPPIILDGGLHARFSECFAFPTGPSPEEHEFDSVLRLDVQPLGPISAPARTRVRIRLDDNPLTTPIEFETELLQLDLVAGTPLGPVMLRESPTRASTGRASIEETSPGMFHIDSFFDVFVELSLDGGANFLPGTGVSAPVPPQPGDVRPVRVVLMPQPGVLALLGIGGLCLYGGRFPHRRRDRSV